MSVVDQTRHNVVPFISGETKAFKDQILLRALKQKGTKLEDSPKALSVNPFTFDQILECLNSGAFEGLNELVESSIFTQRQELFKALILQGMESGNVPGSLSSEELSLSALNAFLEASNGSGTGKLGEDKIRAWFKSQIQDNLALILMDKLGVSEVNEKIAQQQNVYREGFCSLVKPSGWNLNKVKSYRYVLAMSEDSNHPITRKLSGLLDKVEDNLKALESEELLMG